MIKKRIIITSTISLILVAILMIGSTYSIFTSTRIDEEANVYKTGVLDVTYTLSEDNVTLSNSIPMDEEEADGIWPYRITVTNNGTVPYKFNLILNDTTSASSNTIDYKYIMTKVGYLQPKSLYECENNIIKKDIILPAGEKVNVDIRVWVDKNIPNTELGKSFYAKLSIDGLAIYQDNIDINNDALSLKYMKQLFTSGSNTSYFKNSAYKTYIKEASFVNYIDTTNAISSEAIWDVSLYNDNSVVAWLEPNETEGYYNLYIGATMPIYTETLRVFFAGSSGSPMTNLININFENLDTSLTNDMAGMFQYCTNLTSLDLSSFDTSNVTNMQGVFNYCVKLSDVNLSNFNTSKVTTLVGMFQHCEGLTELNLSNFDTSNVTVINNMFASCYNLTYLDVSSFDTSKITNMQALFFDCHKLLKLDLSSFDTNNVTQMTSMFYGCMKISELNLNNFDTSKVTNMAHMFRDCYSLIKLDISSFETSNVIYGSNVCGLFFIRKFKFK